MQLAELEPSRHVECVSLGRSLDVEKLHAHGVERQVAQVAAQHDVARVAQGDDQPRLGKQSQHQRNHQVVRRVLVQMHAAADRLAEQIFHGLEIPPALGARSRRRRVRSARPGAASCPRRPRQLCNSSLPMKSRSSELTRSGCASSNCSSSVVPERGKPVSNATRAAWQMRRFRPASGENRRA